MEAIFVRQDHDRYVTRVTRDDGVVLEIQGFDRTGGLPHDLAHFLVESELGLPFGFWGCIAQGAEFNSARVVDGRRPPHAGERSKVVLKEAGQRLTEAEVLVGVLVTAATTDAKRCWPIVRARLERGWTVPSPVEEQAVESACSLLRETAPRWAGVPVGGELRFSWTVGSRLRRADDGVDLPVNASDGASHGAPVAALTLVGPVHAQCRP